MGVPKFFRWISERYPKIIQRYGVETDPGLLEQHGIPNDTKKKRNIPSPDPLSTCGLPPPIDRLYIDMNGIIHGCSHNNSESAEDEEISEAKIFDNICLYLDRTIHSTRPRELIYMAIDGVAPRAKLNQQRSRRYRSGQEGAIERTIYDAHVEAQERERMMEESENDISDNDNEAEELWFSNDDSDSPDYDSAASGSESELESGNNMGLRKHQDGRLTGKFDANDNDDAPRSSAADNDSFASNFITPGAPFFTACTQHLEHFIQHKLSTDPVWQQCEIVFSGPNVPGEGEHKIMEFMRNQKTNKKYNPNLRHCIMGQDGDLIMLGLVTHEPNLILLREKVHFVAKNRKGQTLDTYKLNSQMEFLHMNVLRDYLALEFETSNIWPASQFDLERTIDDFVFLTFFVGNDFLPHMPALDIADEAFDLLFYTYRKERATWPVGEYLTHEGEISCGKRLESFLQVVGQHETNYFQYKKSTVDLDKDRTMEAKRGAVITPSDSILQSKEESDRERFRNRVIQQFGGGSDDDGDSSNANNSNNNSAEIMTPSFMPVMNNQTITRPSTNPPSKSSSETSDEKTHEGLVTRMKRLLQFSVPEQSKKKNAAATEMIDDTDVKGRYYSDKFSFSPFDAESHIALRQAYVEGLAWNLKYYYQGCVSWDWYYPYHYGPMVSDLVDLDVLLDRVNFEMGSPLRPFEQLMGCLPPSHSILLPEPYRWLMTEETSPIISFYPSSFTVDMNGKRWPWEAVVLLPFIDTQQLLSATSTVDEAKLTVEEKKRNEVGTAVVWTNSSKRAKYLPAIGTGPNFAAVENTARSVPFAKTKWHTTPTSKNKQSVFRSKLEPKVVCPLDGLPTLRDGSIGSMWRKRVFVDVHGTRSRYTTAFLQLRNNTENMPASQLAPLLTGTIVYINYPTLLEAFVTAVSDARVLVRGNDPPRPWTNAESAARKNHVRKLVNSYAVGEGHTGTGGLSMSPEGDTLFYNEDLDTVLYVRPLKGIETVNGKTVKVFAKFEVEVPLFVKSWAPVNEDKRLKNIPALLEKDPYHAATPPLFADQERNGRGGPTSKKNRRPKQNVSELPVADPGKNIPLHAFNQSRSLTTSATPNLCGLQTGNSISFASIQSRRDNLRTTHNVTPARMIRSTQLQARGGGLRKSVLAFGILAASALFSSVNAAADQHTWTSSLSRPWGLESKSRGHSNMVPVQGKPPPIEFAHGTTTLSFVFEHGIIAAVDSRASLGSFVGSKTTQKVLPISSHVLGTMAGGAADCMFWIRKLQGVAGLHMLEEGRRMSVRRISRLLSSALYENRGADLSIGTMIMGFDDAKASSPTIFYVDNSGTRIEGECFAVGSGSTYALGILDSEKRFDMTKEEAISLGIKAIRHSTFRDAYSGGFINVYLITREEGWRRVFSEDLASINGEG